MTNLIRYMKCFLNAQRGAVAIEAAFYFFAFGLLCTLLVDFSTIFLDKSYLERVNNSLALVIRERTVFYDKREELKQEDVDKLYRVAHVLLEGSRLAESNYGLSVEGIYFKPSAPGAAREVDKTQTLRSGNVSCSSKTAISSEKMQKLSPWDHDNQRWMPVYQVTICVPEGVSLFQRAIGHMGITSLGSFVISNAVIAR